MSRLSDVGSRTNATHWTIRAARVSDVGAVARLHAQADWPFPSPEHYLWKMRGPAGDRLHGWVAVHDSRVIGHYATVPVPMTLEGEVRTMLVDSSAVTDPAWRKQGVLTSLVSHGHKVWRAARAAFAFGAPNTRWGRSRTDLGWTYFCPQRWQMRPLAIERALARRRGWDAVAGWPLTAPWNAFWDRVGRPITSLDIRPIARADAAFDALWAAHVSERRVSIIRDAAWVNWRYVTAPNRDYTVLGAYDGAGLRGWVVYRLDEQHGRRAFVVELMAPYEDDEARRALRLAAVVAARDRGAEIIFSLAVPGTRPFKEWRRTGFCFGRHSFPMQYVQLDPALPLDVIRDPANWHMEGGDHDVV